MKFRSEIKSQSFLPLAKWRLRLGFRTLTLTLSQRERGRGKVGLSQRERGKARYPAGVTLSLRERAGVRVAR